MNSSNANSHDGGDVSSSTTGSPVSVRDDVYGDKNNSSSNIPPVPPPRVSSVAVAGNNSISSSGISNVEDNYFAIEGPEPTYVNNNSTSASPPRIPKRTYVKETNDTSEKEITEIDLQAPAAPPKPKKYKPEVFLQKHQPPNKTVVEMSQTSPPKAKPQFVVNTDQPVVVKSYGFSLWAQNLGYSAAISNIIFGIISCFWAMEVSDRPSAGDILFVNDWVGYYALGLGVLMMLLQYYGGLRQVRWLYKEYEDGGRSPLRALFYLFASIPCFLSYPTLLPAVVMVFCSGANFKAYWNNEVVEKTQKNENLCLCAFGKPKIKQHHDQEDEVNDSQRNKFVKWINRQREIGKIGQVGLVSIYIAINVILFFQRLISWINMVNEAQKQCTVDTYYDCVSDYAPWAKAFGQTLNFNCALILVPVLRSLIRKLNNLQVKHGNLEKILPPLRKNVVFHKFIALFVFIGSFGHIFFHFLNLMKAPEATTKAFTLLAFVSGYIVTYAMYIIYSAAQNRVKRVNYEIFWATHHTLFIFYIFLLMHAPKFWIWGTLPLAAYVLERFYRTYRGKRIFYVTKVEFIDPVLCLSFFPGRRGGFQYKEGQYLYLLVPSISKWEWHPFTISSAHEELEKETGVVTLHIRVQKENSWTWRLCKKFREMAPGGAKDNEDYTVYLTHRDGQGISRRGKYLGPDGLPLISIDGPHAAPAQHYSEYDEILLVGAGIGLTPSSAIIQSILYHKWKKGFNPQTIYFCFVLRHSEIYSFRWFIKLLTDLQKSVASDYAAGNLDKSKHRLQIHIFVTRAPKEIGNCKRQASLTSDTKASLQTNIGLQQELEQPKQKRAGVNVNIGFSHEDLELAMLNPTVSSKNLVQIISNNQNAENKLQNIYIWNGRPNWDEMFSFAKLKRQPTTDRVGVCFCGTSVIGKDLKLYCNKYSSLQDNCRFVLHKENF